MDNASWVSHSSVNPFYSTRSLPRWLWGRAWWGLQQLNLVAYPDQAVFDYPRADTTATL
jgi:hypothetical protein